MESLRGRAKKNLTDPIADRTLAARIFLSPDEPRLRSGWRLLIYGMGLAVLFFVFSALMALGLIVVATISGRPISLDPQSTSQNPILLLVSAITTVLIATVATWPARRFLDRRPFTSLGMEWDRSGLADLLFGIGLGGLLMGLIYVFEWAMGWLSFEGWGWQTTPDWGWWIAGTLVVYVCVGYYEELLYRGYLLQNLEEGLNLGWGLLISSVIFSVSHLLNPGRSLFSVIGIFAAGYFLAYGWIRTRQLWIPIGLHIGWNFFQGTVFGFPVSGQESFHLIRHSVAGPELITGGAFGPEAGLTGLLAMVTGVGLIWLYTRRVAGSMSAEGPEAAGTSIQQGN